MKCLVWLFSSCERFSLLCHFRYSCYDHNYLASATTTTTTVISNSCCLHTISCHHLKTIWRSPFRVCLQLTKYKASLLFLVWMFYCVGRKKNLRLSKWIICDCHYGDNKSARLDTFVYFDAKHKIHQIGILSAGKYIYMTGIMLKRWKKSLCFVSFLPLKPEDCVCVCLVSKYKSVGKFVGLIPYHMC